MSRSTTIDFLRPPGTPTLGWVLLAAGALCCATAVWFGNKWSSERLVALRAEQAAAEARREQSRPKPRPAPTSDQLRLAHAQLELRRPWLPALRAVESATAAPIFLLSLTIDPATGLVKLEGEAPSLDHALAYGLVLDEGGALQPAVVNSHDVVTDPGSGRSVVRFAATTRWTTQ
jgi:hypothetical protein